MAYRMINGRYQYVKPTAHDEVVDSGNFELKLDNWKDLDGIERDNMLAFVDKSIATEVWSCMRYAELMVSKTDYVNDSTLISWFEKSAKGSSSYYSNNLSLMWGLIGDAKLTKQARVFLTSKGGKLDRPMCKFLILLDDYTEAEEVSALRAFAKYKDNPKKLFSKNYKPSLAALNTLPTVMRLKCLECLCSDEYISYNIFENICTEDDFRALVFGSSLRHSNRVNTMSERYRELGSTGTDGTINIDYNCTKCGDIRISVKSKVVKTRKKLSISRALCHLVDYDYCPVCGASLPVSPNIHGDMSVAKDSSI